MNGTQENAGGPDRTRPSSIWMTIAVHVIVPIVVAVIAALGVVAAKDSANAARANEEAVAEPPVVAPQQPAETEPSIDAAAESGYYDILAGDPKRLVFKRSGTLFLEGRASAVGKGDFRSYILVELSIDGAVCSADQSYVPANWNVSHFVSASCLHHVEANEAVVVQVGNVAAGILEPITFSGAYAFVADR